METKDSTAVMTFDLKRTRFRIHKQTIINMGSPRYIQFLINPEEMFIAILGSNRPLAGGTANKVNISAGSGKQSVEFYSAALIDALTEMLGLLDYRYSYRLHGDVDFENRVAYFSMRSIEKYERRKENGKRI